MCEYAAIVGKRAVYENLLHAGAERMAIAECRRVAEIFAVPYGNVGIRSFFENAATFYAESTGYG